MRGRDVNRPVRPLAEGVRPLQTMVRHQRLYFLVRRQARYALGLCVAEINVLFFVHPNAVERKGLGIFFDGGFSVWITKSVGLHPVQRGGGDRLIVQIISIW